MKTLYESLFDIDGNFDKLDWNKIDILSLFKAKDEADFINMCEMKFYNEDFTVNGEYYKKIASKANKFHEEVYCLQYADYQ